MGRRAKKRYEDLGNDPYDDYDDLYDDELELKELARDIYSTNDWDDYFASVERMTARRKIERRRDLKKLYSELDEWEEFGENSPW